MSLASILKRNYDAITDRHMELKIHLVLMNYVSDKSALRRVYDIFRVPQTPPDVDPGEVVFVNGRNEDDVRPDVKFLANGKVDSAAFSSVADYERLNDLGLDYYYDPPQDATEDYFARLQMHRLQMHREVYTRDPERFKREIVYGEYDK